MTLSMRQFYKKCDPKKAQLPKKKCASINPKAILLQAQSVSKAPSKHNARALSQMPTWESLPLCSHGRPSHKNLPENLTTLLRDCQETPHSSTSYSCPVLAFFDFQWIDPLLCVYCKMHHCLVLGEHIWTHISRRHKGSWPGIMRSNVLVGFLGHIRKCHPSITSQSTTDLKTTLPDQLKQPLPSTPVVQRYKCPVKKCGVWSTINKGKGADNSEHLRHIKTH